MTPGPKTFALIDALAATVSLLRRHGDEHWSSVLQRDVELLRRCDPRGISELLQAYGGMGSFLDLMLCSVNGHLGNELELDRADRDLSHLRARIWALATEIKKEASIPD
jgi:hypothetical protein